MYESGARPGQSGKLGRLATATFRGRAAELARLVCRWDPEEANSSRNNAQNEFNGPDLVRLGSNGRSPRALVVEIWPT